MAGLALQQPLLLLLRTTSTYSGLREGGGEGDGGHDRAGDRIGLRAHVDGQGGEVVATSVVVDRKSRHLRGCMTLNK